MGRTYNGGRRTGHSTMISTAVFLIVVIGQRCVSTVAGSQPGCSQGFFGADCSQACPVNCEDSRCYQETGHCTLGCQAGFTGPDCTTVCINGYYGVNCTVPCPEHCRNQACSPNSGVCSDGCEDGYWGSDCSLGVELSRSSAKDRRYFYSKLTAEGKSVLLYLLTSRYDQALARAQFEIERAVQDRNEIQHLLQD